MLRRCEAVEAGATIFCVAQKKADGNLTRVSVITEKDGVMPPK
jgi:hypothetical protein